jgi:hypothetical protein
MLFAGCRFFQLFYSNSSLRQAIEPPGRSSMHQKLTSTRHVRYESILCFETDQNAASRRRRWYGICAAVRCALSQSSLLCRRYAEIVCLCPPDNDKDKTKGGEEWAGGRNLAEKHWRSDFGGSCMHWRRDPTRFFSCREISHIPRSTWPAIDSLTRALLPPFPFSLKSR